MIEKIKELLNNYDNLSLKMSNPDIIADLPQYTKLAKEHRRLSTIIPKAKNYSQIFNQIEEDEAILKGDDKELKEIVKDELASLKGALEKLTDELKILLLPKDPNDNKNTIVEIRSGTGGNEAALFAEDLFRMYTRFCEEKKWKYELISSNENEGGGLKEVIFSVSGESVYGLLK